MRGKWKRVTCAALASVLLASMAAGCSGKSSGSGASAEEKVTLNLGFWDNVNQRPTLDKLTAAYTKENPNVTVNLQYTPYKGGEYWTKLEASMNGGTAPDVFWLNCLHAKKYVEGGMLDALDSAAKTAGLDMAKDFPKALVDTYTFSGKLYAMPKDFDTNAVWYNKSLFDAKGVAYPKDGWTWEDMVATAKKLTDPAKGIYGVAAPVDFQSCYWNTIFANGGKVLSSDKKSTLYSDPKTMGGIQPWIDLIQKDKVSPDVNTLSDTSADTLFESGKLAMVWAGSYMIAEYMANDTIKDKVDIVGLPTLGGGKANVINGLGYAVYSKSKQKKAAEKLATWLGGKEAMQIQGEMGSVISARSDSQKYFVDAHKGINVQEYLDGVADAKPLLNVTVASEIYDNESKYLTEAWSGKSTLKDAAAKLDADNKTLLQSEK